MGFELVMAVIVGGLISIVLIAGGSYLIEYRLGSEIGYIIFLITILAITLSILYIY